MVPRTHQDTHGTHPHGTHPHGTQDTPGHGTQDTPGHGWGSHMPPIGALWISPETPKKISMTPKKISTIATLDWRCAVPAKYPRQEPSTLKERQMSCVLSCSCSCMCFVRAGAVSGASASPACVLAIRLACTHVTAQPFPLITPPSACACACACVCLCVCLCMCVSVPLRVCAFVYRVPVCVMCVHTRACVHAALVGHDVRWLMKGLHSCSVFVERCPHLENTLLGPCMLMLEPGRRSYSQGRGRWVLGPTKSTNPPCTSRTICMRPR